MAINSSGAVSLIGTTSGQSIEYELGGSGSTALGLLCTGPRALSHVASGAVTMPGCFYSKHAVPSAPTIGSATACGGSAAKVSLRLQVALVLLLSQVTQQHLVLVRTQEQVLHHQLQLAA